MGPSNVAVWTVRIGFLLSLGSAEWVAWCAHRVDGWAFAACLAILLVQLNTAYVVARVAWKMGVVI